MAFESECEALAAKVVEREELDSAFKTAGLVKLAAIPWVAPLVGAGLGAGVGGLSAYLKTPSEEADKELKKRMLYSSLAGALMGGAGGAAVAKVTTGKGTAAEPKVREHLSEKIPLPGLSRWAVSGPLAGLGMSEYGKRIGDWSSARYNELMGLVGGEKYERKMINNALHELTRGEKIGPAGMSIPAARPKGLPRGVYAGKPYPIEQIPLKGPISPGLQVEADIAEATKGGLRTSLTPQQVRDAVRGELSRTDPRFSPWGKFFGNLNIWGRRSAAKNLPYDVNEVAKVTGLSPTDTRLSRPLRGTDVVKPLEERLVDALGGRKVVLDAAKKLPPLRGAVSRLTRGAMAIPLAYDVMDLARRAGGNIKLPDPSADLYAWLKRKGVL